MQSRRCWNSCRTKLGLGHSLAVLLFIAFSGAQTSFAQKVGYTNNSVDAGARGEMRVDPSTLALGFQLSLGNYPGRAGSSLPINISYSSKVWRIAFEDIGRFGGTLDRSRAIPKYAEHSASGWTTNFDVPTLEGLEWQSYDGLGAGICISAGCPAPDPNAPILYVYRLLAHMPDGSTHELRRDDTPTQSHTTGNVYYAVDGSRIRYDESNQTLFLPDGSRYVFAANSAQYIDRNGNTLNYDQSSKQWTDTLGRPIGRPPLGIGTTGYVTYTIPGVAGSTITYRLRWRNLSEVLTTAAPLRYKGDRTWESQMQTLSPSLFSSRPVPDEFVMTDVTALFNPVVLNEVELPNGTRYTFTYNEWGEIDKVVYPTGAYERYVYGSIDGLSTSLMSGAYAQGNRGVVDRWISVTGNGSDEAQNHWHYSATHNNFATPYTVTITAPDGTYTKRLLYGGPNADTRFGFEDARNGMAYDESSYSATGQMLRRTLTEWIVSGPLAGGEWTATRDPRVNKQVAILLDTGGDALTKTTSFAYDADLNRTSTNEYDYVFVSQTTGQSGAISAIPAGALLRTSEVTYLVNDTGIDASTRAAYRARSLLGLPTSTRLKNPAGSIVAQSSVSYDETSYPLLTYGAITGWTDPGTNVRGNATSTASWLNTTGAWLQTHAQYDQAGSVRNTWDAKGNQSQVEYSSVYHYAYPTLTRTAVPDPSGQYGSNTALVSTSVYDADTGLITSATDANNVTTTFAYIDSLNRLTRTVRASGTTVQSQTTVDYDDTNHIVTTTSDQTTYNDNVLKSQTLYDGLGRTTETRSYEGGTNYIAARQQYDALGRAFKTSNPFRPWQSETPVWTTTGFDALGRVISVTTPDSAVVNSYYNGNQVLVKDQAEKERMSQTNALGQLSDVWEITAADDATEAISFPNRTEVTAGYRTKYEYDTLGNLITVTQRKGTAGTIQTRSFAYDSLSRLLSALNPESGSVSYQYDANGNLTQKSDARGVVSTHTYDALNRNTAVTYSDGTPAVGRVYDGVTNGKGRLSYHVSWGTDTAQYSYTQIEAYDALGRVKNWRQHYWVNGAWDAGYGMSRNYDLAGDMTSQTYPSNRSVNYAYDAAGRTSSFSGNLGDGILRSYSSGISYSPFGGVTQEQFGTDTPIYNKLFYNSRGQLAEIREGVTPNDTGWERGAIINFYSACWGMCGGSNSTTPMPDNNGNLKRQEVYIPNGGPMFAQAYDYDSLNRLQRVNEGSWQQEYVYDRYGNRTIHQTNTWGVPKPNFGVNQSNNRLTAPAGATMNYDVAGNLTFDNSDGIGGTRTYDAENRMTGSAGASPASNVYDADGRRVKRTVNSTQTWQVYGIDGELLAEYGPNGAVGSPQKEYGYRNGQLLVTSEATAGWGAPPTLDDNPLNPPNQPKTGVKAIHITQLRTAINALRAHYNLGSYQWQKPTASNGAINNTVLISWEPIDEMRTALDQALGPPSPGYAAGLAQYQPILKVHIQELRDRVLSAWNGGSGGIDIRWLVADQLGTPRMVIDKSGTLSGVSRHDYLPFGEELFAGTGGRTAPLGYTNNDSARQKFTQKERDNETGLDYFLARYYSSTQGRFTSPDNFLNDTYVADPASWNLYVYVRNNPLKLIDPTGEIVNGAGLSDAERQQLIDDWQRKTGYARVYFDKNNNLAIDRNAGINKDANGKFLGSADARANLTDAVEATNKIFNLESANGSKQVAFADTQLTLTSTNAQTNKTTRTYQVRIDFNDFSHVSGDRAAIDAFSIGIAVLHEFDHNLYGAIIDSPNGPNDPGPVETNYINPIRAQLGLAQRATYSAVPVGGPLKEAYRGYVQVRFTLNGKDKILRWQDSVVGGTHR